MPKRKTKEASEIAVVSLMQTSPAAREVASRWAVELGIRDTLRAPGEGAYHPTRSGLKGVRRSPSVERLVHKKD